MKVEVRIHVRTIQPPLRLRLKDGWIVADYVGLPRGDIVEAFVLILCPYIYKIKSR
jgi:hypothetical protein